MHKKYFLAVIISHAIVITSLFFPLINVNELRIGVVGASVADPYYMNIISFLQNEIYPLTGLLMIALLIFSALGIVNGVFGMISNKIKINAVKAAFVLGFASAVFAALLLYSHSTILFIICALSFFANSFASIRLLRKEEASEEKEKN